MVDRLKMNSIGSGKPSIQSASLQTHKLLISDNSLNVCSIEQNLSGVILTFRSILETYARINPHYNLELYKGQANVYSIFIDSYFVKVKTIKKNPATPAEVKRNRSKYY